MAITMQWIFDRVNFLLKKENKFFTSSDLINMIGTDSFRAIAVDIGYPRGDFSTYMTSGQYLLSTPADFVKVDENSRVTYQHTSNVVVTLAPEELREIGPEQVLTATPGVPENYFMKSETQFGVYPPSTSGCLVIPYVKRPTMLSSPTDTNELTERCYNAAAYWTVGQCLLADSDERAVAFNKMYDREIIRLKGEYNQMYEVERHMKPHPEYL